MRSNRELNAFAHKLRRKQTPAEKHLWPLILGGFSPQKVTPARFIADYYSPFWGVIVELDGGIHKLQRGRDSDRDRAHWRRGVFTIRVQNEQAIKWRWLVLFVVWYLVICFQVIRPAVGWRKHSSRG